MNIILAKIIVYVVIALVIMGISRKLYEDGGWGMVIGGNITFGLIFLFAWAVATLIVNNL